MCVIIVHRLVFSQSLLSLDLIEAFLAHWDKQMPHSDDQVCVARSFSFDISRLYYVNQIIIILMNNPAAVIFLQ